MSPGAAKALVFWMLLFGSAIGDAAIIVVMASNGAAVGAIIGVQAGFIALCALIIAIRWIP